MGAAIVASPVVLEPIFVVPEHDAFRVNTRTAETDAVCKVGAIRPVAVPVDLAIHLNPPTELEAEIFGIIWFERVAIFVQNWLAFFVYDWISLVIKCPSIRGSVFGFIHHYQITLFVPNWFTVFVHHWLTEFVRQWFFDIGDYFKSTCFAKCDMCSISRTWCF